MSLKETYLKNASELGQPGQFSETRYVGWRSPSNIALIKYWGKKANQIPQNPSFSFTLSKSFTETTIEYSWHSENNLKLDFNFEGKINILFAQKVEDYLRSITCYLPFLTHLYLKIESSNSFPHSSGIASSASSMSALALCLAEMENDIFHSLRDPEDFYRKASFLARLGSGSAARSVYGGFVVWGKDGIEKDSTDEAGVPYKVISNNTFLSLKDAILVTSLEEKKVSSSKGHGMMNVHPYSEARVQQANSNLKALDAAIISENDQKFICIIENEALSLHALMLSSDPGYNLLNHNTWQIINQIRDFRKKTGLFIAFSLDAGPNVHLIYKQQNSDTIEKFIQEELMNYCDNGYWIDDKIGSGPVKIK